MTDSTDNAAPVTVGSRGFDTPKACREQAGSVPREEEFALAVVEAAGDGGLENGATVYVGDKD